MQSDQVMQVSLRSRVKQLVLWLISHKLIVLISLGVLITLVIAPTVYANLSTKNVRYNLADQNIPYRPVAIVLGAGVLPDKTPTPYLKMRIETAAVLYQKGHAGKLLMSGDNGENNYNEPEAMKTYAINMGVPADDIIVDHAGFNTYDTCYRAKAVFGVKSAIVVTQGYHLPRVVITCRGLGIDTVGVAAMKKGRDFTVTYIMREYVSTAKASSQLVFKPKPTVLGAPEPLVRD